MNTSETKDKSLKFSLVILTIEQNQISICNLGHILKKAYNFTAIIMYI